MKVYELASILNVAKSCKEVVFQQVVPGNTSTTLYGVDSITVDSGFVILQNEGLHDDSPKKAEKITPGPDWPYIRDGLAIDPKGVIHVDIGTFKGIVVYKE